MKKIKHFIKQIFRRIKKSFLYYWNETPFMIDCFAQARREIDALPEEERKAAIERIQRKIDALDK